MIVDIPNIGSIDLAHLRMVTDLATREDEKGVKALYFEFCMDGIPSRYLQSTTAPESDEKVVAARDALIKAWKVSQS